MLPEWRRTSTGHLQLLPRALCLARRGDGAATLAPCDGSAALLVHDVTTGRIQDSDGASCVGARWAAGELVAVANDTCREPPDEKQQFQFNPQTGALRPKATCVADFAGSVNQYRDCCLSVC